MALLQRNILVADDNEGIVDILSSYLKKEGFNPIKAYDGEEAIKKYKETSPLLILLDIMMPKKDGFEVCKEIRKNSNIPIIMITAKKEEADMIWGLDIGADDYVVKPFSPGAVMARIKAVLRRLEVTEEERGNILRFQELEINIEDYIVKIEGKISNLTKKEVEILWLLASNINKVFSRDNLLDSLWGYEYDGDPRAVDNHIKRLRAKLKLRDQYPWDIKTIWGVGYKFEVQDAEDK